MSKSQAASTIEPRAHPVDRAIAVYGVVPGAFAGRRFTVDGQRAFVVRSGRLGLVTSYVDPGEFAPSEVERRRTDRKWLYAQARHYERVLDRLNARGSVLPMPFLLTYEGITAFETAIRANGQRWGRGLARVTGKHEYGVHVFAGPHALSDPEPYLLRVSLRASRERSATRGVARPKTVLGPLDAHVHALWEACSAAASAVRRFDAPGVRGFAFGAALLVDEPGDNTLRAALASLAPAGHTLGVSVYLEGPRLPFTFG